MGTDRARVEAVVYMSHGRWVAHCPRPGCFNAEAFGRCDDGSVGGLTGAEFRCREEAGGCGARCAAVWPGNVEDLEVILRARPIPGTRNWAPGETLKDLLDENLTHGLYPNDDMELEGDTIRGGILTAPSFSRYELPGGST